MPGPAGPGRASRAFEPAADRRRSRKLANAIYGQIVAMGTTAAYALDDALSAVAILASVTATMLTFWLGHAYAEVVAERVGRVRALPLGEVGDVLRAEWSFVVAVLPTALALGLTGVGVWSRDTGVSVALALGVTALAGWGALIGRRSHATWPSTLVLALVTASLGLAIVGLKVALR